MTNEATKIRVIRAFLGVNIKTFAARMGSSTTSVYMWETGRATPTLKKRYRLAEICREGGIMFTPSGYPIPVSDCVVFQGEKR